ncbi:MAG TPA: hypothetical protein VFJ83_11990 [Nocardioidaceae bacterium]|nr:hypothetical protein [Nocardioidaceae bacterium]
MHNNLGRLGGQLGVGLCLLGFVVIFFGWNGAASTNYVPAQFPYLVSGGIAGLAVVVIGAAMIVVQNQRADRARLEEVLARLAEAVERQGLAAGAGQGISGLGGYVVAGTTSYHQIDCGLPEAREEARVVPLEDVRSSGLAPCRVCRPPQFGRLVTGPEPTPPLVGS